MCMQQPCHARDRPAGVSIKVGEEVCCPVGGATARGEGLPEVLDIGYGRIGALRGHVCVDNVACIAASRIIMTCFVQTAGSEQAAAMEVSGPLYGLQLHGPFGS